MRERTQAIVVVAAILVASLAASCGSDEEADRTIMAFAGTGQFASAGDGGPALEAMINWPAGVAVDGEGNVFISEGVTQRVRRVAADGTISTFAGTGRTGATGDGGPATEARLNFPAGLAMDTDGNLFIADLASERIRVIDPSGVISTVAGSGLKGSSGDGGPAVEARLNEPIDVAVDRAGNLYVADHVNHRVRKVDRAGIITTVAGNGKAGFSGDGGPGGEAMLHFPTGVAADDDGNVYIADRGNDRIRRLDSAGTITTIAGIGSGGFSGDGGPASEAELSAPTDLALDAAGNIFVVDASNVRIRKIAVDGTITTIAGTGERGDGGDGGPAVEATLRQPQAVAIDRDGNIYVPDFGAHRVRVIARGGG